MCCFRRTNIRLIIRFCKLCIEVKLFSHSNTNLVINTVTIHLNIVAPLITNVYIIITRMFNT